MSSVALGFGIAFAVVVISLYLGIYTYIQTSYRLRYPNLIDEHNIELTIRIQPPPAAHISSLRSHHELCTHNGLASHYHPSG